MDLKISRSEAQAKLPIYLFEIDSPLLKSINNYICGNIASLVTYLWPYLCGHRHCLSEHRDFQGLWFFFAFLFFVPITLITI